MTASMADAQSMFVDKYSGSGTIDVYVSDYDDSSVDLRVYKVSSYSSAKGNEGKWYLEADRYNADFKIRFVDSKYNAGIVIYYESTSYNAGWKKTDKKGLFE